MSSPKDFDPATASAMLAVGSHVPRFSAPSRGSKLTIRDRIREREEQRRERNRRREREMWRALRNDRERMRGTHKLAGVFR